MCAIRPTRAWRGTGCGRSRARGASSLGASARPSGGCAIARGRWAGGCARSPGRSAGVRARRRPRCSSSRPRRARFWSGRSARRAGWLARRRARGRGAQAKLKAAARLEQLADRCEQVSRQIRQRVAGEPISDRLVSLADPDARPIRKGKLGKPTEVGYVTQLADVTEHTKRGARGLIVPAATAHGNPTENTLLPDTVAQLKRLAISPREVALDGGFQPDPTSEALAELAPQRVFIAGRQEPHSKRTKRRLSRYRTGKEGRISHLKRRYGLHRSRLKGAAGQRIWTEWAILAYNADTLVARAR